MLFRELVAENANRYLETSNAVEKTAIANEVLNTIKRKGGRFLELYLGDGYKEISKKRRMEKTRKGFRDNGPRYGLQKEVVVTEAMALAPAGAAKSRAASLASARAASSESVRLQQQQRQAPSRSTLTAVEEQPDFDLPTAALFKQNDPFPPTWTKKDTKAGRKSTKKVAATRGKARRKPAASLVALKSKTTNKKPRGPFMVHRSSADVLEKVPDQFRPYDPIITFGTSSGDSNPMEQVAPSPPAWQTTPSMAFLSAIIPNAPCQGTPFQVPSPMQMFVDSPESDVVDLDDSVGSSGNNNNNIENDTAKAFLAVVSPYEMPDGFFTSLEKDAEGNASPTAKFYEDSFSSLLYKPREMIAGGLPPSPANLHILSPTPKFQSPLKFHLSSPPPKQIALPSTPSATKASPFVTRSVEAFNDSIVFTPSRDFVELQNSFLMMNAESCSRLDDDDDDDVRNLHGGDEAFTPSMFWA